MKNGTYHDMAVGATKTKTIDAGPALTKRPRLLADWNFQTPFIEGNLLVWLLEISYALTSVRF
jgi:hypothetical protein